MMPWLQALRGDLSRPLLGLILLHETDFVALKESLVLSLSLLL